MKTKIIYSTLIMLSLFCMVACTDRDIPNINIENSSIEQSDKEEYFVNDNELKYKMQSDKELLLVDRIICKNSVFILDLSEEEAETLQIPTEMYRRCIQYVEELNNKSEK